MSNQSAKDCTVLHSQKKTVFHRDPPLLPQRNMILNNFQANNKAGALMEEKT